MTRKPAFLLTCFLACPLFAQTPGAAPEPKKEGGGPDPVEILKKADEAAKSVKAVRYKVKFQGTGSIEAKTPKVEGSVLLSDFQNGQAKKRKIEAKGARPGSSDSFQVTIGGDGNVFYVIDPQTKTVHEDIDPQVVGSWRRLVGGLIMAEFGHLTPFQDEINGEKHEYQGSEKIGDEDCHKILVRYKGGQQEAVWYFSKKDGLPRRSDRTQMGPDGQGGSTQQIVTNLEVDPKVEDSAFKITVPEGFKKSDDFAP